jgi:hypothetical protein
MSDIDTKEVGTKQGPILEQGGPLVVPGGVEHYGVTLGDEPVVARSVFSPKRDEYAAEEAN